MALGLHHASERVKKNDSSGCSHLSGNLVNLEDFDYQNELMGCILRKSFHEVNFTGITVSETELIPALIMIEKLCCCRKLVLSIIPIHSVLLSFFSAQTRKIDMKAVKVICICLCKNVDRCNIQNACMTSATTRLGVLQDMLLISNKDYGIISHSLGTNI